MHFHLVASPSVTTPRMLELDVEVGCTYGGRVEILNSMRISPLRALYIF